jgi:RimJ/RimL family protein N-acetyltransferase
LTLRCPKRADFAAYRAILTSDRAKYMDDAIDDNRAWLWFVNDLSGWLLDGHGLMSITTRTHETVVGFVSITKLDRFPETELGWMTTAQGEGNGFACEAATAARDWAFGARKISTLVSYIDLENQRSIKLAERMGAKPDPEAAFPKGESAQDTVVYRHSKVAA